MVVVAVAVAVVVVVGQEEVLVRAVAGESDGRNAQAGEGSLESVEPREGALVSPRLSVFPPSAVVQKSQAPACQWSALTLSPKGRI